MLNQIIAVARLTKDPELRKSFRDKSYVNFSVAFDSPTTDEDGERTPVFLDAIAFDQRAELIAKNLHKGSKVALRGSLNQRDFLRKDGSKGRAYEIYVESIEFLDPKPVQEDDEVCGYDSAGSLSGETFTDEEGNEQKLELKKEPQFDPYTGKPLTKAKKNK